MHVIHYIISSDIILIFGEKLIFYDELWNRLSNHKVHITCILVEKPGKFGLIFLYIVV